MVYYVPREFFCNKCGNKQTMSPSDMELSLLNQYCYLCLKKFLDENIGKLIEVD